jgi:hypothetical protein
LDKFVLYALEKVLLKKNKQYPILGMEAPLSVIDVFKMEEFKEMINQYKLES